MARKKAQRTSHNQSQNNSNKNEKRKSLTPQKKPQQVKVMVNDAPQYVSYTKPMLRVIRNLQSSTKLLIPKLPFARLIREILFDVGVDRDYRIQTLALQAIQEACEIYMTQYFGDSYLCTLHAKRVTLNVNDLRLCRRIRGRTDIINH